MIVTAIIVAAGKGTRFGGNCPKQFQRLGNKAIIAHAVDGFATHPDIAHIIIVIGEGQEAELHHALSGRQVDAAIIGGAERQDSVRQGLIAARALHSDIVLIHDAARPLVPGAVIDRLLNALGSHKGAVPILPVVDTLAHTGTVLGDVVPRDALCRVQTPQAFHLDAIMTSHEHWTGTIASDDAQMARQAGYAVAIVDGDRRLEKLTHKEDFEAMEAILSAQMINRVAMGYDVHQLVPGEDLWLAGVRVPHDKGLAGHSDADVALHAITDALLGTIGDGDIGSHFPPSEPQWKGARSARFVEHARDLIAARGGIIDFVDVTLVCEAPKIGPHREAMKAVISKMLGISIESVSVKATTTERLGFTGRGEGIAAQAVATVRIPLPN
jgi:2-C-methyl-D-erythritol 4-phosphate cytidylyltransferase / 2-C-methyl-D-erythritol 2,4-cyclodiphosphate synthase